MKSVIEFFSNPFEYFEALFRSYRFSDEDVHVMDQKGYYFDAKKGRFRTDPNGRRGWYYEIDWRKEES